VNPLNTRDASWHIAIDDEMAVEAIPLNEVAYHAGDYTGNRTSIGIEICESGDREKTLNNSAIVVAKLLKKYGWGTDKLKRHYDWSGKNCPRILNITLDWSGWTAFKLLVDEKLKEMD
jgi:N-acetylmuramoyl-L-alanine amidase